MTLSTFISQRRGAAADLARALGVNHSTVLRWASGEHAPSLKMCAAISKATGGAVTAADFLKQAASA
jgi:DNA-binding transcriptional regulator YdaS (Cro superfamily)